MQAFALLLCTSAFANNAGDPPTKSKSKSENSAAKFYNIFFTDSENDVLFIDFEAVQDNLREIKIVKDGEILLTDDVSDVSSNDIYEVNYSIFQSGIYMVEIVTEHDITIRKSIIVD